jgi:hypothetical protein
VGQCVLDAEVVRNGVNPTLVPRVEARKQAAARKERSA